MAVLINKKGRLQLLKSQKILTGPQRIAQIVHCQERLCEASKDSKRQNEKKNHPNMRHVFLANTHLSFPGGPDDIINARKQTCEAMLIARALEKEGIHVFANGNNYSNDDDSSTNALLQIIGGDFNSNSCGMAAQKLTKRFQYVNCACATAEQTMCSGSGGRVNLGVTHRTHRGEDVSVDHIFARLLCNDKNMEDKNAFNGTDILPSPMLDHSHLRNLGYLPKGVQVLNTRRQYLKLDGESIISDHRPVTAELKWPRKREKNNLLNREKNNLIEGMEFMMVNTTDIPLDPLQPPWPMS